MTPPDGRPKGSHERTDAARLPQNAASVGSHDLIGGPLPRPVPSARGPGTLIQAPKVGPGALSIRRDGQEFFKRTGPWRSLPHFWPAILLLLLFGLTLPTVKLKAGVDLRLGQLLLVMVFILVFLRDLSRDKVAWPVVLIPIAFGLLLSAISWVAPWPKIKEETFFIKYIFLFPAALYLGYRAAFLIKPVYLARVLELTLVLSVMLCVYVHFRPVPALIHARGNATSPALQGTFWEQGHLASFIGLFCIASIALRINFRIPSSRLYLMLCYGIAAAGGVASKNKTIWIALTASLIAMATLVRPEGVGQGTIASKWRPRILGAILLLSLALFIYNDSLEENDRIVTVAMLRLKWEHERGAALRLGLELISEAPWGGHGFGFVEAYFSQYNFEILGLGENNAHIFNSYLDIWLSVGIVGFLYALGMLRWSLGRWSLVSVAVVVYLFVCANANPEFQSEYYHLFLGIAAANKRMLSRKETATWVPPAQATTS